MKTESSMGSQSSATAVASGARPGRRARRWLPYVGAVIVVGLIIAGLWPRPIPVETATATVGALRATVNEEGKTRIRQRYVVSAPVGGQLQRIPFKAGAQIEAGKTVLAVIAPLNPTLLDARARTLAEARRDQALANLEKARAGHSFATNELQRFEKLFVQQTVSPQELDSARWREVAAAREETAAEGALRQAEAELAGFSAGSDPDPGPASDPREILAPINGRVLRVFEENARVVLPGTALLEVGDPADLEVVVDVLSRDGAMISPGAKVEFDQWGGSEPLQGRVRLVEPAAFTKISALGVEEQRVNVIVDLVTPAQQRLNLGDNFRVEARILVWEADDALKVPTGALFRRGERWATFVMADGRAELRWVKVGRSSGTETQVLDGLKPGEQVILYPGSRVKEDERVTRIQI
jgi:HlyD family secretion protein